MELDTVVKSEMKESPDRNVIYNGLKGRGRFNSPERKVISERPESKDQK
jgi:hypothetical protein